MAEQIVELSKPDSLQSGIVKSLHKLQVPMWIDGQNVIFEDGAAKKSKGRRKIFTSLEANPIIGIRDILKDNNGNLLWGDFEKLYRWDGTTVTEDGSAFGGTAAREFVQHDAFQLDAFQTGETVFTPATQWSMEAWGTWCLASNGVDPIQINKLDGSGFAALAGTPPTHARVLVRLKQFILAFNTDLGGEFFEWCDLDNVEQWVGGAAGFLPIRDMDSEIMAACRLGNVVAAYSRDSMALVQWIGSPYYFGAQKVLTGIGAVGILSVVEDGNKNYGVSKAGIWETDGASFDYISPPFIREWLKNNVNWQNASKIAGMVNEDRTMVEWGVPIVGGDSDNTVTVCYNKVNKSWTFRSWGITAGLKKGIFDYPIFGDKMGNLYYGEYGNDDDTAALDAWVQSRPFPGTNLLLWKSIEYLLVHMKTLVGSVNIYLGTQVNLNDAITWSEALIPNQDSAPIFKFMEGRFVSFKIESNALASDFSVEGLEAWGNYTGASL